MRNFIPNMIRAVRGENLTVMLLMWVTVWRIAHKSIKSPAVSQAESTRLDVLLFRVRNEFAITLSEKMPTEAYIQNEIT